MNRNFARLAMTGIVTLFKDIAKFGMKILLDMMEDDRRKIAVKEIVVNR